MEKKTSIENLRNLTLLEVQQKSFEILQAFHDYCVENGLRYQLAYGTCLGAVRHKGFIPWDDDVDVMMPRPDFEKLERLITKKPIDGFELLSLNTNKIYTSPLAKIHSPRTLAIQKYYQIDKPKFGVYIDVFVVDGIPDGKGVQKKLFKHSFYARRLWELAIKRFGYEKRPMVRIMKEFVAFPFRLSGYRPWVRLYESVSKKYDYKQCSKAGIVLFGEGIKKEIFERSMFEESILLEFEGGKFYVPSRYDEYLKQMYGDYMQLPPEEQRVSKHGTDFYYLNVI